MFPLNSEIYRFKILMCSYYVSTKYSNLQIGVINVQVLYNTEHRNLQIQGINVKLLY